VKSFTFAETRCRPGRDQNDVGIARGRPQPIAGRLRKSSRLAGAVLQLIGGGNTPTVPWRPFPILDRQSPMVSARG
jgi:hypothetical protein